MDKTAQGSAKALGDTNPVAWGTGVSLMRAPSEKNALQSSQPHIARGRTCIHMDIETAIQKWLLDDLCINVTIMFCFMFANTTGVRIGSRSTLRHMSVYNHK